MADVYDVAVLIGSLRRESFSRKIAALLSRLAPAALKLTIVEIGQLTIYNQDEEPHPPAAWTDFRHRVKAADAVLFVTPEYNRSVPAVLRNAIDVGSRPYGSNAFDAKPGAVVSVSLGALGGFGANHHLRQSLVAVNVPAMAQPEAYLSNVGTLLDEAGEPASEATRTFLTSLMTAFAGWVATNAAARA